VKKSDDPLYDAEKPIAERRVSNKGNGKTVYLYQSQIDEMWKHLQQQPETLDMLSEEYRFRKKDMYAARDRAMKQGFAYDPALIELAETVGIGMNYVLFSKLILKSLWKKMGLEDNG